MKARHGRDSRTDAPMLTRSSRYQASVMTPPGLASLLAATVMATVGTSSPASLSTGLRQTGA